MSINDLTEHETTPLRADVPLDMHPDTLAPYTEALEAKDSAGRMALTAAREAMVRAYTVFGSFNDIEAALYQCAPPGKVTTHPDGRTTHEGTRMTRQGPRAVPPAAEVEAYVKAADVAQKGVAAKMDRSLQDVRIARQVLERTVAKALTDPDAATPNGMTIASEIRTHVKSMPHDKRTPFVDRAIRDGDFRTVAAVLAGPSYLSGLEPKMFDIFRDVAARRWAGPDYAQLLALPKVEEALIAAGALFMERWQKARTVPRTPMDAAKQGIAKLEKAR